MVYKYDEFLAPINENSKVVKILNNGEIIYTIVPRAVVNSMISNNILKINMRSQKVIQLQFSTINETKIALELFMKQIEIIRSNKVPSTNIIEIGDIISLNNKQYKCWYREDKTGNNFKGGIYDGDNIYIHLKELGTENGITMLLSNILDMKHWNSLIWQELHPGSLYGKN